MSISPAPATATTSRPVRRVFVALVLAPLCFLVAIVAFSAVLGADAGGDAAVIAERITQHVPQLLLTGQLLLVAVLVWALRRDRQRFAGLGWRAGGTPLPLAAGIGVAVGAALAGLYLSAVAPAMESLQRTVGDFVAPGEMLSSFGTDLLAFFVANVVLAPVVEESLYRGYALPRLRERWGTTAAVVISCAFFGALHWSGGFWYMLATGLVAGLPFALLTLRWGLLAALAAHLTLNVIEFAAVAAG